MHLRRIEGRWKGSIQSMEVMRTVIFFHYVRVVCFLIYPLLRSIAYYHEGWALSVAEGFFYVWITFFGVVYIFKPLIFQFWIFSIFCYLFINLLVTLGRGRRGLYIKCNRSHNVLLIVPTKLGMVKLNFFLQFLFMLRWLGNN